MVIELLLAGGDWKALPWGTGPTGNMVVLDGVSGSFERGTDALKEEDAIPVRFSLSYLALQWQISATWHRPNVALAKSENTGVYILILALHSVLPSDPAG